jgi:hypothetical protein
VLVDRDGKPVGSDAGQDTQADLESREIVDEQKDVHLQALAHARARLLQRDMDLADAHESIRKLRAALQDADHRQDVGRGGISQPLLRHMVAALDLSVRGSYELEISFAEERARAADNLREAADQTAWLEQQLEEVTAMLAHAVDALAGCERVCSDLEDQLTMADLELEDVQALLTRIASRSAAAAAEALFRKRAVVQEKKRADEEHARSAALAQAVDALKADVAAARMRAAAAEEAHGQHLRRRLEDTHLPAERQATAGTVDVPAPSATHEDEADELEVSRGLLIDGIVTSTSDVGLLAASHANDPDVTSTPNADYVDNLFAPDGTAAAPEPDDSARQLADSDLPLGLFSLFEAFCWAPTNQPYGDCLRN